MISIVCLCSYILFETIETAHIGVLPRISLKSVFFNCVFVSIYTIWNNWNGSCWSFTMNFTKKRFQLFYCPYILFETIETAHIGVFRWILLKNVFNCLFVSIYYLKQLKRPMLEFYDEFHWNVCSIMYSYPYTIWSNWNNSYWSYSTNFT